jgi:hypothetical protein
MHVHGGTAGYGSVIQRTACSVRADCVCTHGPAALHAGGGRVTLLFLASSKAAFLLGYSAAAYYMAHMSAASSNSHMPGSTPGPEGKERYILTCLTCCVARMHSMPCTVHAGRLHRQLSCQGCLTRLVTLSDTQRNTVLVNPSQSYGKVTPQSTLITPTADCAAAAKRLANP